LGKSINYKTIIDAKWSAEYNKRTKVPTRWWQSPYIIRHINQRICGVPIDGLSSGLIFRAKQKAGDRLPFRRGVSIGCGNAFKEIQLLREGVVQSFMLFELSDTGIKQGKELAIKEGLQDRTEFIAADALELIHEESAFDFVHWNNSLHHMTDVEKALRWSYKVLKNGGMFYMDEYVGPNRFQWTDKMLEIASDVRKSLPDRYLRRHSKGSVLNKMIFTIGWMLNLPRLKYYPRIIQRPYKEKIISDDPSEAVDSERILECVKRYFPNAEITLSGGVVYHLALCDILHNFDESRDCKLLERLMDIDDECAARGETHYATALEIK